jgi:hypothetical protein
MSDDEEFPLTSSVVPFTRPPVRPIGPVPPPNWNTDTDPALFGHLTQLSQNASKLNYLITMGSLQLQPDEMPQFFTWISPQIGVSDLATASTLFQMEVISLLTKKK